MNGYLKKKNDDLRLHVHFYTPLSIMLMIPKPNHIFLNIFVTSFIFMTVFMHSDFSKSFMFMSFTPLVNTVYIFKYFHPLQPIFLEGMITASFRQDLSFNDHSTL